MLLGEASSNHVHAGLPFPHAHESSLHTRVDVKKETTSALHRFPELPQQDAIASAKAKPSTSTGPPGARFTAFLYHDEGKEVSNCIRAGRGRGANPGL